MWYEGFIYLPGLSNGTGLIKLFIYHTAWQKFPNFRPLSKTRQGVSGKALGQLVHLDDHAWFFIITSKHQFATLPKKLWQFQCSQVRLAMKFHPRSLSSSRGYTDLHLSYTPDLSRIKVSGYFSQGRILWPPQVQYNQQYSTTSWNKVPQVS